MKFMQILHTIKHTSICMAEVQSEYGHSCKDMLDQWDYLFIFGLCFLELPGFSKLV